MRDDHLEGGGRSRAVGRHRSRALPVGALHRDPVRVAGRVPQASARGGTRPDRAAVGFPRRRHRGRVRHRVHVPVRRRAHRAGRAGLPEGVRLAGAGGGDRSRQGRRRTVRRVRRDPHRDRARVRHTVRRLRGAEEPGDARRRYGAWADHGDGDRSERRRPTRRAASAPGPSRGSSSTRWTW